MCPFISKFSSRDRNLLDFSVIIQPGIIASYFGYFNKFDWSEWVGAIMLALQMEAYGFSLPSSVVEAIQLQGRSPRIKPR